MADIEVRLVWEKLVRKTWVPQGTKAREVLEWAGAVHLTPWDASRDISSAPSLRPDDEVESGVLYRITTNDRRRTMYFVNSLDR